MYSFCCLFAPNHSGRATHLNFDFTAYLTWFLTRDSLSLNRASFWALSQVYGDHSLCFNVWTTKTFSRIDDFDFFLFWRRYRNIFCRNHWLICKIWFLPLNKSGIPGLLGKSRGGPLQWFISLANSLRANLAILKRRFRIWNHRSEEEGLSHSEAIAFFGGKLSLRCATRISIERELRRRLCGKFSFRIIVTYFNGRVFGRILIFEIWTGSFFNGCSFWQAFLRI